MGDGQRGPAGQVHTRLSLCRHRWPITPGSGVLSPIVRDWEEGDGTWGKGWSGELRETPRHLVISADLCCLIRVCRFVRTLRNTPPRCHQPLWNGGEGLAPPPYLFFPNLSVD